MSTLLAPLPALPNPPLRVPSTRKTNSCQRLIAAALDMFSTHGMAATTREIAEAAGLNEVTLFRIFETKDGLLAAVVHEVVRAEAEALDRVDLVDFDIRRDITAVAGVFYDTHHRHQAFIRTILSNRLRPELTEEIIRQVVQTLRDKFIRYLTEGQRRGLVRADIELTPAVDAFTGMIFASVLRRAVYHPGYARDTYLATCVDLFVRGITPLP